MSKSSTSAQTSAAQKPKVVKTSKPEVQKSAAKPKVDSKPASSSKPAPSGKPNAPQKPASSKPVVSAKPADKSKVLSKPSSKTPVNDSKSSGAAKKDVKSTKPAVKDIKSTKAPANDNKSSKAPVKDTKSSKAPVKDTKSSKAPIKDVKSSKALPKDSKKPVVSKPAGASNKTGKPLAKPSQSSAKQDKLAKKSEKPSKSSDSSQQKGKPTATKGKSTETRSVSGKKVQPTERSEKGKKIPVSKMSEVKKGKPTTNSSKKSQSKVTEKGATGKKDVKKPASKSVTLQKQSAGRKDVVKVKLSSFQQAELAAKKKQKEREAKMNKLKREKEKIEIVKRAEVNLRFSLISHLKSHKIPELEVFNTKYEILAVKEFVHQNQKAVVVIIPGFQASKIHAIKFQVISALEKILQKQVYIVAKRKIIPKPSKRSSKPSFHRPNKNTLTAVHDSMMNDLIFPSDVMGKRTIYHQNGSKITKVFLDRSLREKLEHKMPMLHHLYKHFTGADVSFSFYMYDDPMRIAASTQRLGVKPSALITKAPLSSR